MLVTMSKPAETSENPSGSDRQAASSKEKPGWPAGRPRPNQRHGATTLKRAIRELGDRAIDGRTSLGRALEEWKAGIVADMGGSASVSRQQEAIIDMAAKTKLLLDSIDGYLFKQATIVNKRKRAVFPVVRERIQLADALARYLTVLGLERRSKAVPSLQGFLENRAAARKVAP